MNLSDLESYIGALADQATTDLIDLNYPPTVVRYMPPESRAVIRAAIFWHMRRAWLSGYMSEENHILATNEEWAVILAEHPPKSST